MKWWLAAVGAVVGLLGAAGLLIAAYAAAPSVPGMSELILQLGIVGVLIVSGAVGGFVVGWLIDLGFRRRR